LGTDKLISIRPALVDDIPSLLELGRLEHHESGCDFPYSIHTCERMLQMVMLDSQAVCLVIAMDDIPYGYIIGGLDHIDMSPKPIGIAHKWFVYNPTLEPALDNAGAKLLKTFEHWAASRGATDTMVTLYTNQNSVKYYGHAFDQMGYKQSRTYYSKRLINV